MALENDLILSLQPVPMPGTSSKHQLVDEFVATNEQEQDDSTCGFGIEGTTENLPA